MIQQKAKRAAIVATIVLIAAIIPLLELSDSTSIAISGGSATVTSASSTALGLSSLPLAAQAVISATLGRDDARYWVGTEHGALHAQNPAQALGADFTPAAVKVRAGKGASVAFALRGYGYGDRVEQVHAAAPQSQANRVEYWSYPVSVDGLGLGDSFRL
ncbi:MAG: hypothetical protein ACLQAT_07005 [Candidatus Binataceae bacterium]